MSSGIKFILGGGAGLFVVFEAKAKDTQRISAKMEIFILKNTFLG